MSPRPKTKKGASEWTRPSEQGNQLLFGLWLFACRSLLLFELLLQFLTLLGAGLGTLLRLLAELLLSANQLDERHFGGIALARTGTNDSAVTAIARSIARSDDREETVDRLRSHQVGSSLTAGMHVTALAQSNHLLDQRLGGLGLGDGGFDTVVEDDRGHQTAEHRTSVRWISSKFEASVTVAHFDLLRCSHLQASELHLLREGAELSLNRSPT